MKNGYFLVTSQTHVPAHKRVFLYDAQRLASVAEAYSGARALAELHHGRILVWGRPHVLGPWSGLVEVGQCGAVEVLS